MSAWKQLAKRYRALCGVLRGARREVADALRDAGVPELVPVGGAAYKRWLGLPARVAWLARERDAAAAARDRLRDAALAWAAAVDEERRALDLYDRTPVVEMLAPVVVAQTKAREAERALRSALEASDG